MISIKSLFIVIIKRPKIKLYFDINKKKMSYSSDHLAW